MLTYDLNNRGSEPLYVYLYRCIREDINTGKLKAGEKLPSKRTMADHLNVGVITVTNAYAQLETEGYIEAVEKRGYFVQDVTQYDNNKVQTAYLPELKEKQYYADFKANLSGLRLFPATTWNHYMREALSMPTLLKSVPYKGLYELRESISRYLHESRGMDVSPSQIIVGAGTEYLYSRLLQMFGHICTFGMEDPGYRKFEAIARANGNPIESIPIDRSGIRVDLLEESSVDVVHVSPANHFPTGIVMPIQRRIELFRWADKTKKRFIIEDDYDSEFRYSGKLMLPLYAEDWHSKVIYINTFSKSMVPSLRISYMVLPPSLMKRYEETMSFYSNTVSSFEQYALAGFIRDGHFERHINRMKNYYKKKRAIMLKAIAESPLANISRVIERNAGTHFMLSVRTSLSGKEIRRRANDRGIAVSLFSDYSNVMTEMDCRNLIINYAGVPDEKVTGVVLRLTSVFPECELPVRPELQH